MVGRGYQGAIRSGLFRRVVVGSNMVWVSRLGGARCGLVGSCAVRFCKAWTSWRGSARCGAVILGQSWQCEVWHGFHGSAQLGWMWQCLIWFGEGFKVWCGLLKWGKAGRGMVLQGFLGEVKCGMVW